LGDVVLAAETVRLEAQERGIEPRHHLQHLVVHGLLHLLGYDHQTGHRRGGDGRRLETDILATIGVADPHAASAVPDVVPMQLDSVILHDHECQKRQTDER